MPAGSSLRPAPFAWLLAAALVLATAPTAADPGPEDVGPTFARDRNAPGHIDRGAAGLAREIERLDGERVSAGAAIQSIEVEMSRLEEQLARLAQDQAARVSWLAADRRSLAAALSALTRLARRPPAAIVVPSAAPSGAVRGGVALRATVAEINRRADRLRTELAALAAAAAAIAAREAELKEAADALATERSRLDGLLAEANALHRRTAPDGRRPSDHVRRLSEQAKNVNELLVGLTPVPEPRSPPPDDGAEEVPSARLVLTPPPRTVPRFSTARGSLPLPAAGRVVGRFDEHDGDGLVSKGITIATRSGALVVSPHYGRVAFAGPFRGYGQLLIIEHGERYHTLISGLGRIDAVLGQVVSISEPVGMMGSPGDVLPRLYLEIRHDDRPVDPLPWFAVSQAKVSG